VPLNPIQALKQRKMQQQKEAEEKRIQQLLEAEEWRTRRAQSAGGGSAPPSPSAQGALTDVSMAKATADAGKAASEDLGLSSTRGILRAALCEEESAQGQETSNAGAGVSVEAMLTPKERRALRHDVPPSPRGPPPACTAASQPPLLPKAPVAGEATSAPDSLDRWRSPVGPGAGGDAPSTPRARSSNSAQPPHDCGSACASEKPQAAGRLSPLAAVVVVVLLQLLLVHLLQPLLRVVL